MMKKNNIGKTTLPDLESYCKVMVHQTIKLQCIRSKQGIITFQINKEVEGTKQGFHKRHTNMNTDLAKGQRQRMVFPTNEKRKPLKVTSYQHIIHGIY